MLAEAFGCITCIGQALAWQESSDAVDHVSGHTRFTTR
jgi:hypothetical protein